MRRRNLQEEDTHEMNDLTLADFLEGFWFRFSERYCIEYPRIMLALRRLFSGLVASQFVTQPLTMTWPPFTGLLSKMKVSRPAWSFQETTDLVNYLYERKDEISLGIFSNGIFQDAALYLGRNHQDR